jgi:hypothetical protein
MTQGVLHRAGVAIMLITMLLLPYGRCQSPTRATRHDCCVHPSAPVASVKASCCTVRSEVPAIVEQRAVVSPHLLVIQSGFIPAAEPAMQFETSATTAAAHHFSPPGKSILRI